MNQSLQLNYSRNRGNRTLLNTSHNSQVAVLSTENRLVSTIDTSLIDQLAHRMAETLTIHNILTETLIVEILIVEILMTTDLVDLEQTSRAISVELMAISSLNVAT